MGTPLHYITLPKFLLHAAFLIGYVRRSIYRVLGIFKETVEVVWPDEDAMSSPDFMAEEDQNQVLRLETFAVIQKELGDELKNDDAICAVCLNEFAIDEKVLLLINCCHVYHEICLRKWLDVQQKSCPLCRSPLTTAD